MAINAQEVNQTEWRDKDYPLRVLFENKTFSIVWGKRLGHKTLGMRWNGESETDDGYPLGKGGRAVWFNTPDYLAKTILQKLLIVDDNDEDYKEEYKNRENIEFAMRELTSKTKTQ